MEIIKFRTPVLKLSIFAALLIFTGVQGYSQTLTAGFTYNQNCLNFEFFDASTASGGATITDYLWDFGDPASGVNNTSNLPNPTHTFSDYSGYSVSLTVSDANSGDWNTFITSVNIILPVAGFNYTSDCESFSFQNSSTPLADIDSVYWHFGEGDTLRLQTPQSFDANYSYSTPGEYTVFLKVFQTGCSDTVSHIVSFYQPEAGFTYTNTCGEFQFNNESQVLSGTLSYFWEFDDGTNSTDEDPLHVFADPGDHEVMLTVTHESGCQSYFEEVVSFYEPIAHFSYDPPCLGIETCFYDESLPSGEITSWLWDFGNGNSSSLQNPCYIYGTPGEYIVSLIVTNTYGCSSEPFIDTLQVDFPPEADFISSLTCFNQVTVFDNLTDTNNVAVSSWLWDFGDPASGANTSSLFEPTHLFSTEGTFQVSLSVENVNGCSSFIIKPVVVDSIPEADFIIPDTIAAGNVLTIIDNSIAHGTPILIRSWNFGDGVITINPNPVTHIYTDPGNFEICLIVTNLKGCTDTLCQTIVVTSLPHADFDFTIGPGLTTHFTDQSYTDSFVVDWFWDFGDLTVSDDTLRGYPNPSYTYPTEGFYSVYLRIHDYYGGVHDTSKTIYVGTAVIADFSNVDVCSGENVKLYDDSYTLVSADFISWYWDFGDNTDTLYFERADSIYHHYDTAGFYDVTFATTGLMNGIPSTDTIVKQVKVYNPPTAQIDSLNLVACLGQPINFVDSSYSIQGDSINSWQWDFGDGGSSILQNPSYIYDSIKEYQVILTINTTHFCENKDTIMAKVTIAPDIDFVVENACVNSPAYFIHTESDIEITDWFWNFNDQYHPGEDTSSLEAPSYVFTHIDIYNVTMEASSFGCVKKVTKTFIVYPIPYSDFTFTPNYSGVQGRTIFYNGSIYADRYLWDFGNGHTSNVADPIEVYEHDSTYTITLISFNEWCSDTSRYQLTVFFKGLYFPTAFSPNNPNYEVSRFVPKGINLAEYSVQVFDLKGNLMWESDKLDENGSPVESWDGYCNGLLMPEGMYVWQAKGVFRDGTEWKGSDLQYENPQTNGTVTLIK